jgi:hypothetical protein
MNPISVHSTRSRAFAVWASWWDGIWLCAGFSIALGLSVVLPAKLLKLAVEASEPGVPSKVAWFLGLAYLLLAGPVVLSRLFRELDFGGGPIEVAPLAQRGTSASRSRYDFP